MLSHMALIFMIGKQSCADKLHFPISCVVNVKDSGRQFKWLLLRIGKYQWKNLLNTWLPVNFEVMWCQHMMRLSDDYDFKFESNIVIVIPTDIPMSPIASVEFVPPFSFY